LLIREGTKIEKQGEKQGVKPTHLTKLALFEVWGCLLVLQFLSNPFRAGS
jgi:hypothetical protein